MRNGIGFVVHLICILYLYNTFNHPSILPLQCPSHMISPFFSLSLHLLLPHPYPLTTLTFPNPCPHDARPEINTFLPIFTIIIVFSLQRLLLPRPTFGILSTQFYLILVFLLLIVIPLCPFLFLRYLIGLFEKINNNHFRHW